MTLIERFKDWFGFGGSPSVQRLQRDAGEHGHTHGTIDPTITATARGIWAVKWSFIILALTTLLQAGAVVISGSVALLADTVHNAGDAVTAIPLWIAFALARRPVSKVFTYGLGRVEDIAGVMIVLIILFSALVAGYESISRFFHPVVMEQIWWVAVAGVVGFLGNEAVAVFRIRVGREINSAALIADGYHARTDGLTSLAVVGGAIGVAIGLPLADPIVGLLITIAIFGIVWQSAKAVFTRMLDGVEPSVISEIRHVAAHVADIREVVEARARWIGHRLQADVTIAVARDLNFATADHVAETLRRELRDHLPALGIVNVNLVAAPEYAVAAGDAHHAPDPFRVTGALADGILEISDTPNGERMVFWVGRHAEGLQATVAIERGTEVEELVLGPTGSDHHRLESRVAPAEPHEFAATLYLAAGDRREALPFNMTEPAGRHGHAH